jgi:N-acetylglucosamine-6-sulfatase
VIGGRHYEHKLRQLTVRPEQPELARLRSLLRQGRGLGEFGLDRAGSFNEEDVDDKPPFIRQKRRLSREEVADVEIRNALRRAALKSVDRRIADLMSAVRQAEQRTGRPTYVVFSSDGGFFLGEHRLPYEKNWHYGAATDVPLVISGPDVRPAEVAVPVANVDLAPTLLHMAGVVDGVTTPLDGRSLLPLLERPAVAASDAWEQRAVLLEGFWGITRRRRYSGVRTKDHVYVEHYAQRDGRTLVFTELYDRQADPGYRSNLLHGDVSPYSHAVAWRLDALLDRLRSCAGQECDQRDRPMAIDIPQSAPATAGAGQGRNDRARRGPRSGGQDAPRAGARAQRGGSGVRR